MFLKIFFPRFQSRYKALNNVFFKNISYISYFLFFLFSLFFNYNIHFQFHLCEHNIFFENFDAWKSNLEIVVYELKVFSFNKRSQVYPEKCWSTTPLIYKLNTSKITCPKFDFYVSKYLKKYSVLEYKFKTVCCHSKE